MKYEALSKELTERIASDRAANTLPSRGYDDKNAIRRDPEKDKASIWRNPFVRDTDKIMHCPFYSRYADKTQVFAGLKSDDITRRSLHVQLVSRIARTIGANLNLNCDLIEAISLGHDIGHTPFGHMGEKKLDELLFSKTGLHFCHNLQSVRVLDFIFPYNITLQTLSGIATHDGETEMRMLAPISMTDFKEFDETLKCCSRDKSSLKKLAPITLEACVVRIADIIAYLGKDRQDASIAYRSIPRHYKSESVIGSINAEIINNLIVNIIENSYDKPYIAMDEEHFTALKNAKKENYDQIYLIKEHTDMFKNTIFPMMEKMYDKLYKDYVSLDKSSPIYSHHLSLVSSSFYARLSPYDMESPDLIVADYIASMTDDYFSDLFDYLFPGSSLKIDYTGYF